MPIIKINQFYRFNISFNKNKGDFIDRKIICQEF